MSVKITIEHGNQNFRRTLEIHRVETDEEGGFYDARHLYRATLSGGIDTDIAEFRHRYGDPLQALFVEAVAALEMGHGRSNRPLFDVPEEAKPQRLSEVVA